MIPSPPIQIPTPEFKPLAPALEVLRARTRFNMVVWHRRARKTTMAVNKLIRACCSTPREVYGYIGPTYKQAKSIVWRDPNMLPKYCPRAVLKKDPNESELYLEFYNGSILQILGADNPDSIRGKNFKGVVLDEFALMKPEIWTEILRPIFAQNKGWADFLFTPKGRNHAYKMWRDCENWADWGRFFLAANTSGIISPEELLQASREMSQDLFRQEFLCEFLEGEGTVFRRIMETVSGGPYQAEDPVPGHSYVLGLDLARLHDYTVLTVLDISVRPVRLVYHDRFNQIDWAFQKQKILATAARYNRAWVWMDSTGVGDGIEGDLRTAGANVWGYKFSNRSKKELIEFAVIAIEQKLMSMPEIPQLLKELQDYAYELLPGGMVRYSAPEGENFFDDCVISLALALQGAKYVMYQELPKAPQEEYPDLPPHHQEFWKRFKQDVKRAINPEPANPADVFTI